MNTIVAETVRQLVEKGMKHPPIFYSANLDGGDELNRQLYEEYKDTIFTGIKQKFFYWS